jgi:hypothetical protein
MRSILSTGTSSITEAPWLFGRARRSLVSGLDEAMAVPDQPPN